MRFPFSILLAALLVAGCGGNDPVVPVDTSFGVTVTVVDGDGAPVEGLNVNIVNDVFVDADKIDDPGDAFVSLPIQVLQQATVRVLVRDIEGATLRTIVSATMPAGRHIVQWDGRDNDGAAQPAGRYTLSVIAFPGVGSNPLFSDSVDVYLRRTGASFTLGVTDAQGVFRTTDTRVLPSLVILPAMIATDATGQRNGILDLLPTATITVWRDGEHPVSAAIAVDYGPNAVTLVYAPAGLKAGTTQASHRTTRLARPAAKADTPRWELGDPYPNPFN